MDTHGRKRKNTEPHTIDPNKYTKFTLIKLRERLTTLDSKSLRGNKKELTERIIELEEINNVNLTPK